MVMAMVVVGVRSCALGPVSILFPVLEFVAPREPAHTSLRLVYLRTKCFLFGPREQLVQVTGGFCSRRCEREEEREAGRGRLLFVPPPFSFSLRVLRTRET